jgi:hypothetical protein
LLTGTASGQQQARQRSSKRTYDNLLAAYSAELLPHDHVGAVTRHDGGGAVTRAAASRAGSGGGGGGGWPSATARGGRLQHARHLQAGGAREATQPCAVPYVISLSTACLLATERASAPCPSVPAGAAQHVHSDAGHAQPKRIDVPARPRCDGRGAAAHQHAHSLPPTAAPRASLTLALCFGFCGGGGGGGGGGGAGRRDRSILRHC